MPPASATVRFSWFDVVAGVELHQGDILTECPVLRPAFEAISASTPMTVTVHTRTGIILTQSCDLAVRADGKH